MKYILLFMMTSPAWASPIKVFFEGEALAAFHVKEQLLKEYQIPEELIEMKEVRACGEEKGQGRLNLCLKNNGDLVVVSVDREFINESLRIFRAP